ncbi:MAG: hypothetical protein M3290_06880 [Actinomycetota bacterium]|nr:hypothetical protein [Actinomycetota bacterium]
MQRIVQRSVVALCLALVCSSCYVGDNPNLTSTGKGKPQVTFDFPDHVDAGEQAKLVLDISNPGPGDIPHVFVGFALLGDPTGVNPLIPIGAKHKNPAVVSIDPKPEAVSSDADIYRFGPLREGRSTTITFVIDIPDLTGRFENSVQVYDGNEPDRSVGVRLETMVGG